MEVNNNLKRKIVNLKKILSITLFSLVTSLNLYATDYYFSSSGGNDSRSVLEAQNESTPWKSIDKLNSITPILKGGDRILFKSGDIFFGSITVTKGGSDGNPITFTSYGSGNRPIITSLEIVTGWQDTGGGIYEAEIKNLIGDKIQVVLIDNTLRPMGRYPNANASNGGYLLINSVNNNLSINGENLPHNFSGGEIVVRKNNWIIDRHEIQSSNGGTINYLQNPNTFYNPQKGFGYFVQNHRNTLDQFGEWAYSKTTKKISVYFGGQNPTNLSIQVAKKEHLVTNNQSVKNLSFRNLDFRGSNKNLLMIQKSGGVTVDNCSFDYAGENAIFGSDSPDFIVRNNQFNRALSGTIFFWYGTPRTLISDNLIENSMPFQGMAKSSDLTGIGIYVAGDANNAKIERNRVLNSGFNGIHFGGNFTLVKNNLVDNFCLWKQDGGGIYTNSDGLTNMNNEGREIIGNIVKRGIGAQEGSSINYKLAEGIYIDDNSQGVTILQNTITEINGKGIYIHNNQNIQILENTIYKVQNQLQVTHDNLGRPVRNVRIERNQFSSVYENEVSFSISSILDDINQIGVSDNNYFLDPYQKSLIFHSKGANEGPLGSKRNLSNWKETFGFDRNSKLPQFNLEKFRVTSSFDIKSSNFDSNINLVSGTYNGKSDWITSGITGGTWRVTPTSGNNVSTFIQIGATSPGDEFLIEFDTKSGSANKSVELLLEKTFNQNQEGNIYYFASSTDQKSVKILLKSKISSGNESIVFRFPASIQSLFIDNLKITRVKTEEIPVTDYVFFQYNYSGNAVSHSLNGVYQNAKGEIFDRVVNIPAYGSALLVKIENSINEPENLAPSIAISQPNQNQVYLSGQEISIKTIASDPENKIQKVEFFQGETLIHVANSGPYEFIWKNAPNGNYILKAKIFDDKGLTAESPRVNISVISAQTVNLAPSVSLIQPSQNQSYSFGQDVIIRTIASDPENKIQKVEFFQGDQVIAIANAAPFQFDWKNAPVGNYSLKAKIFDDKGLTAESARINISINAAPSINQAPSVNLIQPSQNQIFTIGQEILIRANAIDPENKIQKVEFFQGDQVIAIVNSAPFQFSWKNVQVGNYLLKAKIFDDKGLTAESSRINISVNAASSVNQAPSVNIIQPSQNQSFTIGQEILIRTNALDPENKIQKVEFFYGEQIIAIVNSAPYQFTWKNAPQGIHVLKTKIFDDKGLTAESSRINIAVNAALSVNLPPSVSIIQPSQNQNYTFGQDILIRTNANDPENKIQKVEFFYGEQMIGIVNTAPFQINWKNAPAGNHILKTKIFDDKGLTSESSRINVSINKAPSVTIIQPFQNQSFSFGQDILITTNAIDPENKIQKVEFFYGEQIIAIVNSAPYQFTWRNAPVGNHVLKTKIFDEKGLTAESSRINISVKAISASTQTVNVNQIPTVSIIQPSQNQSFQFGQEILIKTNATDPENKIQKVEFFYGEQIIGLVTKPPYQFNWKSAPIGSYTLKTKIFDENGQTNESSRINIKVENSASNNLNLRIVNPGNNQVFTTLDSIPIEIKTDSESKFDSIAIYLDDNTLLVSNSEPSKFQIKDLQAGERKLTARAFQSGNVIETEIIMINVFTDTLPSEKLEFINPSKEILSKEWFEYSIGPNPTDNILNVFLNKLPKDQEIEIQLFDINGITLKTIKANTDLKNIAIEIGTYPAGIYFMRILNYNMDFGTKRIIKK